MVTSSGRRLAFGALCLILLSDLAAAIPAKSTLIVLSDDVPAGLDYDGPAAAIPSSQTGFINLMEPLVEYARAPVQGEGIGRMDFTHFEGRLAESWSFDAAHLVWTFHLRRGVRSCAGNLFTADDVIYTLQRAKSVSGSAPIGWFLASVASIDGFTAEVLTNPAARKLDAAVEKVDQYTIRVRQSAANPLLLPALATFGLLIFDSHEAARHATAADPWAHQYTNNVAAAGFGPYCVERWLKGNEFVLRSNNAYYRGAPAIPRVVIKRIPQSANRYVLMRMGQAHLAERLTPKELQALRGQPGVRVAGVIGNESLFLHMNFKVPPFDNPTLRQAIAYAVPYEQIIRTGYFGEAVAWHGIVPSSYPFFAPSRTPYRYDPARASALLAKAGYPHGRGLERFGTAFHLNYVAEKEPTLGPIATVLRTALRRLGIPVELEPIPLTQYGDRQLIKKDLEFALNDQEKPAIVDAGYAIVLFFVTPSHGGVNNMVQYDSPRVDELWMSARTESDPGRRGALLSEAQQQLMDDVAWLPLVEYRTQWALDPSVEGLTWYPDNAIRFADLSRQPARTPR